MLTLTKTKVAQRTYHGYVIRESHQLLVSSVLIKTIVYIAARSSNGNGAVWTKLAQDGLNGGSWAVDKLIANKVSLPISNQAKQVPLTDPGAKSREDMA